MPGLINSFLRTELTIIPQAINKYVISYNNTITNGATWMFIIWTVLHFIFDKTINMFLLKMQYTEYIRLRLRDSLWNLGFYSSCFWFCSATLYKNDLNIFNQKSIICGDHESATENFMIGFVFLISYMLHSSVRNCSQHGFGVLPLSNFFMALFLLASCLTRKLELSFALLAIASFAQSGTELVRILICLKRDNTKMNKFLSKLLLIIAVGLLLLSYGFTIPIVIIIPLLHELFLRPSFNLWLLNFTVGLWISAEIFNNVLYKLLKHIVIHEKTELPKGCLGNSIECSLFFPRDDIAYHLKIVRREIEERRQGQLGLRKPKNKNVLFQTLKSVAMLSMMAENSDKESMKDKTTVEMLRDGMVAIRRKLYQKRLAESSDSESEGENIKVNLQLRDNLKKEESDLEDYSTSPPSEKEEEEEDDEYEDEVDKEDEVDNEEDGADNKEDIDKQDKVDKKDDKTDKKDDKTDKKDNKTDKKEDKANGNDDKVDEKQNDVQESDDEILSEEDSTDQLDSEESTDTEDDQGRSKETVSLLQNGLLKNSNAGDYN